MTARTIFAWVKGRWFDIGLVLVVVGTLSFPEALWPIADRIRARFVVVLVMFLMSVSLPTRQIVRAMRAPAALVVGVLLGYTAVPGAAYLAGRFGFGLGSDFGIGLLIMAAMPCTLASATIFTRLAGGNDAISLLITLVSNLLSFAATPLVLLMSLGVGASLDPLAMTQKLLIIIVVPVGAGQLLRRWERVSSTADRQKPVISVLSRLLILSMVFAGMVKAAMKLRTHPEAVTSQEVLLLLLAVVVIHGLALWIALGAGGALGLPGPDRIALLFGGSQKTLPAALYVVEEFFPAYALASVPCLAYHALQLMVDSLLTEPLKRKYGGVDAADPGAVAGEPEPVLNSGLTGPLKEDND